MMISRVTLRFSAIVALAFAGLAASCGSADVRRFPDAPTVWVDPDESGLESPPKDYFSGLIWDAVDQTLFIPSSRYLSIDATRPSVNVNAMDEVPNSSWFTNRIGLFDMDDAALRRGSCPDDRLDTDGPWTVTAAKPNGANPGFIIRDADGRGWLLKFDGHEQPERATAADVFGSRVYHAAGFWSPCNTIVFFEPDVLTIADDAEAEDELGNDVPMEQHHVQQVLDAAVTLPDGRLRASASLFLPGRPLGPFTYQGRRRDDPNDAIRHQDRRELRGANLLAAWLNHFDAREQNTLTIWAEEDGRGFVRHYYLDFGDCLGSRWDIDGLSRRFGRSYYLDPAHVTADFLTLGAIQRPWDTIEVSELAPELGYFDVEHFDPANYHAGYPNPSFASMQDGDAAWMARILARFDEAAVRSMLAESELSNPVFEEELVRVLMARRQMLLETWLPVASPLANFEVQPDGTTVCFEDLATMTGVLPDGAARYDTRAWFGDWVDPAWARHDHATAEVDPGRVCVDLTHADLRPEVPAGTPVDAPERYVVVDIVLVPHAGSDGYPPARLHFYDRGEAGFRLVGIERPADHAPPGRTR